MKDVLTEKSVKTIHELTPLKDWILKVDDQYIIETISDILSRPRWDYTEATYSLQHACLSEWKRRYCLKPIPKIAPDIDMVLNMT